MLNRKRRGRWPDKSRWMCVHPYIPLSLALLPFFHWPHDRVYFQSSVLLLMSDVLTRTSFFVWNHLSWFTTGSGVFTFQVQTWISSSYKSSLISPSQNTLGIPLFFFFLINLFIYLHFIFGCVGSLLRWVGATLHCGVWASHCSGFSCCRAWALGVQTSVVVAHGLSSCGS